MLDSKSLVISGTVVVLQYYRGKRASGPENDRLKIQLSDCSHSTIIGVYMLSNGYTGEYKSCLYNLEEVYSVYCSSIMLVGDFNAHLAGPGNICIPNSYTCIL